MSNGVQQFVLDENEDSPWTVISCLNFIATIKSGYVIEVDGLKIYENGYLNRLWRTIFTGPGQRKKTMEFFRRVIGAAFGFIPVYLQSNDNDRKHIGTLGLEALKNCIKGLTNHQKTYIEKGDLAYSSQIKVLIDTINLQIPKLEEEF